MSDCARWFIVRFMSSSDLSSISPPPEPVAPSRPVVAASRSVSIRQSCTVRRPAAEVYAFWRNVSNFVGLVKHPVSITQLSETESRWVVSGPPGARIVEWHALIITDEPGRLIAWRSREGAHVPNAGSVHFTPAPGDEGTEVTVELRYEPPAGRIGTWLAKLTGKEPAQQVANTLRRLKALLEAGEIPTTAGQPQGKPRGSRDHQDANSEEAIS